MMKVFFKNGVVTYCIREEQIVYTRAKMVFSIVTHLIAFMAGIFVAELVTAFFLDLAKKWRTG